MEHTFSGRARSPFRDKTSGGGSPRKTRAASGAAKLIRTALREDIGTGDVTGRIAVPADAKFRGRFIANCEGVLCGMSVARMVFKEVSPAVRLRPLVKEGGRFRRGGVLGTLHGPARAVLAAERTALNFLQRLSGVATLTARYVDAVRGTGAAVYDTRKTTPGFRELEKYAVRTGGGSNHRMGLYDQVLFKDNHISAAAGERKEAEVIEDLVQRARREAPGMTVEIEVEDLAGLKAAFRAGADIVMLDNFTPAAVRRAAGWVRAEVRHIGRRPPVLEASGGITLSNVRRYAEAGADRVSVGALTHSAPAADISLAAE
jgi:nicotinate-nucleotide pyrophosphorylase (carboxylating)